MFNVVVVGADGSKTARRAAEAAAELAAMPHGTLHIVTAHDSKVYAESPRPSEFQRLDSEGDVDALLQTPSFIGKKHGLEPVPHAATGDPAEVIIKRAEKVGADLVVVGHRG
jgi:nucleotide-binding universal stress UspA family protein